ncbi:MAG: substrate-binding domain-containing protein [Rhodospirillaceae bacterium]|nr:substrate-binding domain-containing protein [Rhodospirillaceae bacterium]MCA8930834.1 substrate-binding domain-containing protein [Rhodospirillaceae bacterium]
MKSLITSVSLAALMAVSSGTAAFAQDDPIRIGAALYGLRAEFMQLWAAGAESHPAVMDGTVELTIFDGNYDALVQQNQFETMITEGYDAIIFVPIDVEAGATAVQMAYDAGIPVIGSNTRINTDYVPQVVEDGMYQYVGSNDVLAGRMEAEAVMADFCDAGGRVVIIEGPIGQSAQIDRREGNEQALAECPNVELLEMQTANWSRAEALTLMENWLTSYQGDIDGVIGQNDEMALGAIEAITQAGLDVGDYSIAGIDGITDALVAVQEGTMVSILQDANAQAQGAVDLALRHVLGEGYEPMSPIWAEGDNWYNYGDEMPWNGGADAEYNVPWTPVTQAIVGELLDARQ